MSSILTYRGYQANITFDADDNVLVGEVINADPRDTVFFGGESIKELHDHFHDVIDTYVDGLADRAPDELKEM